MYQNTIEVDIKNLFTSDALHIAEASALAIEPGVQWPKQVVVIDSKNDRRVTYVFERWVGGEQGAGAYKTDSTVRPRVLHIVNDWIR